MHYVTTSFTRKKNNFVFEVNFFAARSTSTQKQNKKRYFRMSDQHENNNLTQSIDLLKGFVNKNDC